MRVVVVALIALVAGPGAGLARCIQAYRIDHTEVKSDREILFYMNDRTVYANYLPQRCPDLKASPDGVTYAPTDPVSDELCDDLGTFRVNEGGSGPGAVCLWGTFVPVGK
jgi:hypothetical protein